MKATAYKHLLFQRQNPTSLLTLLSRATFTATAVTPKADNAASAHVKHHIGSVMDPRFYENDFYAGKSKELEFVRSPFYDLAKEEQMNKESAGKLIDDVTQKMLHIEGLEVLLQPPVPTKENVAYTRYADVAEDQSAKHIFQFPRGQPYRIVNNAELFRIQNWSVGEDRWAAIKRSKAFIADKFFPPFALKEGNLHKLFVEGKEVLSEPEDS